MLLALLLVGLVAASVCGFHLFHTNDVLHAGDHHCLYRYGQSRNGLGRYLLAYCLRSDESIEFDEADDHWCEGSLHRFVDLRRDQVTPMDLYDWQCPVDILTDYADYLQTDENGEQFFCNCSSSNRFGVHCEYEFVLNGLTIDEIVDQTFAQNELPNPRHRRFDVRRLTEDDLSCYVLFNCSTYVNVCLDWRQICDGLRDCVHGEDEEQCLTMELTECDTDREYRCTNGLCIPRSFSFDLTFDCLDFSDEQMFHDRSRWCSQDSSIDCDEHSCGLAGFSCADGSCFQEYFFMSDDKSYQECFNQRNSLYIKDLFRKEIHSSLNDACWAHMWCLLGLSCLYESIAEQSRCAESVSYSAFHCRQNKTGHLACPKTFFFPPRDFLMPSVRLLYENAKDDSPYEGTFHAPSFVCVNATVWSQTVFDLSMSRLFEGYQCYLPKELAIWEYAKPRTSVRQFTEFIVGVHSFFSHRMISATNVSKTLFRCPTGLFISSHRLHDRSFDCFPHRSDESASETCDGNVHDRFRCLTLSSPRCIPRRMLRDGRDDCFPNLDEFFSIGCTDPFDCQYFRHLDLQKPMLISYSQICDGYQRFQLNELHSDESDCEHWPCNARSIRCNGVWNRKNGCDELNCPNTIAHFIGEHVAHCAKDEHYCLRYNSSQIGCLPLSRANDGVVDCLFNSDERLDISDPEGYLMIHQMSTYPCVNSSNEFVSSREICDGFERCPLRDDELLCPWRKLFNCSHFVCENGTCLGDHQRCDGHIDCLQAEDEWTCDFQYDLKSSAPRPFRLEDFSSVAKRSALISDVWLCYRGLLISRNASNHRCLCPSNSYGSRCQYQNERLSVSFRLELEETSQIESIYQLVFSLLDENEEVQSMETFVYSPLIHSSIKHVLLLPYPRLHRSLRLSSALSLRIDAYLIGNDSVEDFLSWFYPVAFPFLPVTRLSVLLTPPHRSPDENLCSQSWCEHGTCHLYSNTARPFCRCWVNWIGRRCDQSTLPFACPSISRSTSWKDSARCVCPLGRTGRRCELIFNNCEKIECLNAGRCYSLDIRTEESVCVCPKDYFGGRCEYRHANLLVDIPAGFGHISVFLLHFLHSSVELPGMFVYRDLHLVGDLADDAQLIVHTSHEQYLPSIILVQIINDPARFYGDYYLFAVLPGNVTTLRRSIRVENRCPHVSERLNSTMMQWDWLKRVKFYHHFFVDVKCFYDETYMCLVDDEHMPDCLHFNHAVSNCTETNFCLNGGRCLQRRHSGQVNFVCLCSECVRGRFCQIQLTQFSLTFDSILIELIVTDASWDDQPVSMKILTAWVIVTFVISLFSNGMSFVTFLNKDLRQYGCGNYLFILCIVSQLAMIAFVVRFVQLLVGQMSVIENHRWLSISCLLSDYILLFLIAFSDWLTACVACERTSQSVRGILFDRRKSVRMVKFIVPVLIVVLLLASALRPFSQVLIVDPANNDRYWCVIEFREVWHETWMIVVNIANTVVPFLINFITAIILLISFTRMKQRTNQQTRSSKILRKQLRDHKDLLISPLFMIAFKLPSIIVMLRYKCLQSSSQLSLSLFVYCASLVPLTTNFLIFVFPSTKYRRTFLRQWKALRG